MALKGVTKVGLDLVIGSCYTGLIKLNKENIEDALLAASHLAFRLVEGACEAFLLTELSPSTALNTHTLAFQYNLPKLAEKAMIYVGNCIEQISRSQEFRRISLGQFEEILKCDILDFKKEKNVFELLMYWVKFDRNTRAERLPHLLKCIRTKYLNETVSLIARLEAESRLNCHLFVPGQAIFP